MCINGVVAKDPANISTTHYDIRLASRRSQESGYIRVQIQSTISTHCHIIHSLGGWVGQHGEITAIRYQHERTLK